MGDEVFIHQPVALTSCVACQLECVDRLGPQPAAPPGELRLDALSVLHSLLLGAGGDDVEVYEVLSGRPTAKEPREAVLSRHLGC